MKKTKDDQAPVRVLCLAAAACAALLLSACYSSSDLVGDGGEDGAPHDGAEDRVQPDPATDPVPDPVPDLPFDPLIDDVPEEELPGPGITFILSFITDIPDYEYLYVQTSDMSCYQTWISITDGAGFYPLESDCAICPCDSCDSCAVCGACMPMVAALGSGDSITYEWDGTVYYRGMCAPSPDVDMMCEYTGSLRYGDYLALFCFSVAGPGAYPDQYIPDPFCVEVPFSYPVPGGVVRYTVDNGG